MGQFCKVRSDIFVATLRQLVSASGGFRARSHLSGAIALALASWPSVAVLAGFATLGAIAVARPNLQFEALTNLQQLLIYRFSCGLAGGVTTPFWPRKPAK